jgi:transposase
LYLKPLYDRATYGRSGPVKKSLVYVGLDVHKNSIVIAMAAGKQQAVFVKTIPNDWVGLLQVLDSLGAMARLRVCYEAGPTGYGLARRLDESGIYCIVIAPSLIPVQSGKRVKTDRRDARQLADLLRAGLLTEVKIPEAETEAMRDLERARDDAKNAERTARHQLDKFLLRYGRIWSRTKWTRLHWSWIKQQAFATEVSRRVLADNIRAVEEATARVERLENDIEELVETWSLAALVRGLQALWGVRLITAVILAAEIGDFARFVTPRQLMSYLGQVPSEDSSGQRRHQGRITRTGNGHARRILTEAAWNYRFRPRASRAIRKRRESLPPEIVAIAEKAEQRLSRRYQHLVNKGKSSPKAVSAVARELTGFVWAIAREVRSQAA